MGGTGSLLPEGKLAQGHLHAHPPPLQFVGQGSDPRRYGVPCSEAVSMSPRALPALATGPIPIRRLEGLCPHPPPDNVIRLPEV